MYGLSLSSASMGVSVSVCVCVQYVSSLHLTRFESDVGGGKRHTELVCTELGDFREAFIKTDPSRYGCLILPSSTPLLSSSLSFSLSLVSGSVNRK